MLRRRKNIISQIVPEGSANFVDVENALKDVLFDPITMIRATNFFDELPTQPSELDSECLRDRWERDPVLAKFAPDVRAAIVEQALPLASTWTPIMMYQEYLETALDNSAHGDQPSMDVARILNCEIGAAGADTSRATQSASNLREAIGHGCFPEQTAPSTIDTLAGSMVRALGPVWQQRGWTAGAGGSAAPSRESMVKSLVESDARYVPFAPYLEHPWSEVPQDGSLSFQ